MATLDRKTTPLLLENGDRLTRSEFERRYQAMPQSQKAELIEGVVYMASPVRVKKHGQPHSHIITWLGTYRSLTLGVMVCDNTTVRLDLDNEPQPDGLLRIDEVCGGQSRISEDDYVEGAPELIVEIAASSASYDLYDKKNAYRRNGVREYIVWQVIEQTVSWFALEQGKYIAVPADSAEIIHSRCFPGLSLQVSALLAGDLAQVLAEVQRGTATAEHKAFVQELSNRGDQDN
ncbi:MAG: Uma2 family endonuclease [Leptolyngbyaceae cyanobacterium SM1_1_3]|nr:Uma2 family endonuclease [Leptolyngbyaceae cyanobacterium SM1_1_3]NJN02682.1 Uma2 family endonuclease [Leptolyngbyaceae cyanobacterium RM1_1_2]